MWLFPFPKSPKREYFYSHIPCGMWPAPLFSATAVLSFLLTHPVWDVTSCPFHASVPLAFLLTHPVWDVTGLSQQYIKDKIFLLTHPVWDVTKAEEGQVQAYTHFYSHIPCGMWQYDILPYCKGKIISTHTSRVGCDRKWREVYRHIMISTHTSRVGCDISTDAPTSYDVISTHTSRVGCDLWPFS